MTTKPESRGDIREILSSISLDAIVRGFTDYVNTFKMIASERRHFARKYIVDEPRFGIGAGIAIFLYGVALTFVLYIPIILKNELKLDKIEFLLQFLYSQVTTVVLIHIAARSFGGKGTLYQTASGYSIWIGFASPIVMLLNYPFFYYAGFYDFVNYKSQMDQTIEIPTWAVYWNVTVFTVMVLTSLIIIERWIADIHRVTVWRIVVSWLIVALPLGILHSAVVAPFVSKAIEYTATFIGEIL